MLRSFLRLFAPKPQRPTPLTPNSPPQVVLYAHLERSSQRARTAAVPQPSMPPRPHGSHRERLLSMSLEHIRICSPQRCQRFRQLGILTAGDLSRANPERLAGHFAAQRKALRLIKQYRRAIRFAAAVPGMMPRDALLLIAIHRRSVRGLASESAARLHRDLERFAESTQGRLQLRGRRLPSTRRLKRWIVQCESVAMRSPMQTRAA